MSSAAACDLDDDIWSQRLCSPQPSVAIPSFDEYTAGRKSDGFKRWTWSTGSDMKLDEPWSLSFKRPTTHSCVPCNSGDPLVYQTRGRPYHEKVAI